MRRTRSMENLNMLPEEARLAASLLRLTSSDKQETTSDCGFQSYMRNNNQFPYHRSILIVDKRPEPVTTTLATSNTPIVHHPSGVNTVRLQHKKRVLRRRCESSPISMSCNDKESKSLDKMSESCRLSQSAPSESQGFFQRLFPAFLRRRFSKETEETVEAQAPVVVTAAPPNKKAQGFPEISQLEKDNSGHFVRQFVRMENKMDNLLFMSLR